MLGIFKNKQLEKENEELKKENEVLKRDRDDYKDLSDRRGEEERTKSIKLEEIQRRLWKTINEKEEMERINREQKCKLEFTQNLQENQLESFKELEAEIEKLKNEKNREAGKAWNEFQRLVNSEIERCEKITEEKKKLENEVKRLRTQVYNLEQSNKQLKSEKEKLNNAVLKYERERAWTSIYYTLDKEAEHEGTTRTTKKRNGKNKRAKKKNK